MTATDAAALPAWMRRALLATAAMNVLAAALFVPPARGLRALAGLPEDGHPLYLVTVAMFVLLFGLGYLWAGLAGRIERLFITLAAIGKISFFTTVAAYWIAGELPFRAALMGTGDLVFGVLFVIWLLGTG